MMPQVPPPVDLNVQSTAQPNSKRPGQSAVYRRAGLSGELPETNASGVRTCYENILYAAKQYGQCRSLGHRPYDRLKREHGPYVWETYAQTAQRVEHIGAGLHHIYQEAGGDQLPRAMDNGQHALGLYSVNRPEWLIGELAGHRQRLISVALYDTLGPETVEFILNHAEVPVLMLSADKILNILNLRDKLPLLKVLVSMDPLDTNADMLPPPTIAGPLPGTMPVSGEVLRAWAAEKGLRLLDFAELEQLGRDRPAPPNAPSPDDVATFCYTSGTTGNPKGALLTHRNMISASLSINSAMEANSSDTHISYLPLAHVFERVGMVLMLHSGVSVGFYRGDTAMLLEDIAILQPTLFITVPRLLNRIYDKLTAATIHAPGLVGAMARRAVASKLAKLERGEGYTHAVWDRLLFNKVRQVLGGRVRSIITGSAPASSEVLSFLRIAFCCEIHEGYGQTENSAAACITLPGEYKTAHVGVPIYGCELMLADIPEMNYLSSDQPEPRGEICLRGPIVFRGYLKDPEKTAEALDANGWLHTGDVGRINANGSISVIDRKKNIFKLAQGEYVAPEKIENIYVTHPCVAQVFVHGDSLRAELVAVVVPDMETLPAWAARVLGGGGVTVDDAWLATPSAARTKLYAQLVKELNSVGRKARLHGFEQVRNVRLVLTPFSVENQLLTPTFKLKRMEARAYYRALLDEMYEEIDMASKPAATAITVARL